MGGRQAIMDEDFHILTIEAQFALQARFLFQTLARVEGCAGRLFQSILIVAIDHALAIVTNPQPIVAVVDAVVTFQPAQYPTPPCPSLSIIPPSQQPPPPHF